MRNSFSFLADLLVEPGPYFSRIPCLPIQPARRLGSARKPHHGRFSHPTSQHHQFRLCTSAHLPYKCYGGVVRKRLLIKGLRLAFGFPASKAKTLNTYNRQSIAQCVEPVNRRTRIVLKTSPGIAECERQKNHASLNSPKPRQLP